PSRRGSLPPGERKTPPGSGSRTPRVSAALPPEAAARSGSGRGSPAAAAEGGALGRGLAVRTAGGGAQPGADRAAGDRAEVAEHGDQVAQALQRLQPPLGTLVVHPLVQLQADETGGQRP